MKEEEDNFWTPERELKYKEWLKTATQVKDNNPYDWTIITGTKGLREWYKVLVEKAKLIK